MLLPCFRRVRDILLNWAFDIKIHYKKRTENSQFFLIYSFTVTVLVPFVTVTFSALQFISSCACNTTIACAFSIDLNIANVVTFMFLTKAFFNVPEQIPAIPPTT